MSQINRNLINAARTIIGMTSSDMTDLILAILADNPSVVYRHMNLNTTFKVVFSHPKVSTDPYKIPLIKEFRSLTGAFLADAKHWTEGKPYTLPNGVVLEPGVFRFGMTHTDATNLAYELNKQNSFVVKVMPDNEPYTYKMPW